MTQNFIIPGPSTCSACGAARAAGHLPCPQCRSGQAAVADRPGFFALPAMRYPNAYTWLVFLGTLDIILTYLVLYVWGGHEVNPIAAYVIDRKGFGSAILFKYALVLFAILLCEFVGRLRERDGRRLSVLLMAIGAFPVVYTFGLLLLHDEAPAFP
jgi:hypothetical protein